MSLPKHAVSPFFGKFVFVGRFNEHFYRLPSFYWLTFSVFQSIKFSAFPSKQREINSFKEFFFFCLEKDIANCKIAFPQCQYFQSHYNYVYIVCCCLSSPLLSQTGSTERHCSSSHVTYFSSSSSNFDICFSRSRLSVLHFPVPQPSLFYNFH